MLHYKVDIVINPFYKRGKFLLLIVGKSSTDENNENIITKNERNKTSNNYIIEGSLRLKLGTIHFFFMITLCSIFLIDKQPPFGVTAQTTPEEVNTTTFELVLSGARNVFQEEKITYKILFNHRNVTANDRLEFVAIYA